MKFFYRNNNNNKINKFIMNKANLISILIALLWSCGTHTSAKDIDDSDVKTVVSLGIKEFLDDDDYFKDSRILFLETNDNSLLRKIDRICVHDNRIFIYDNTLNKIVIFDMDGKYLNHIHRIGYGPQEYDATMDFCLDTVNRQILLLCDRPYKIMKFKYSGEFIEEKRLDGLFFNIMACSEYIYCNKHNPNPSEEYELFRLNSNCTVIDKSLLLKNEIVNFRFSPGKNLTTTLNTYYTRRFDNSIYKIENDKVKKEYIIDFKDNTLPENFPVNDESNFYKNIKEKQYIYSITEVSESKNYIFFNTNIAIFVLDKEKGIVTGYKIIDNSKLQRGSNSYFSVGNNSEMIASVIEPFYLHIDAQTIKAYPEHDPNNVTLKLEEKVKDDDNPILILYEFKDSDEQAIIERFKSLKIK
jgi:hypothetical protein